MHPFDGLFSGREIVDTVGLAEDVLGLFGRRTGLPSASSLDKRYPIPPIGIPGPYEDRFAFARDEDISFVVYCDPIFCEDGNGAGIGRFAYAHERVWEIVKCVRLCSCWTELRNGQLRNLVAAAHVPVSHTNPFGGASQDR